MYSLWALPKSILSHLIVSIVDFHYYAHPDPLRFYYTYTVFLPPPLFVVYLLSFCTMLLKFYTLAWIQALLMRRRLFLLQMRRLLPFPGPLLLKIEPTTYLSSRRRHKEKY